MGEPGIALGVALLLRPLVPPGCRQLCWETFSP